MCKKNFFGGVTCCMLYVVSFIFFLKKSGKNGSGKNMYKTKTKKKTAVDFFSRLHLTCLAPAWLRSGRT